MRLNTVRTGCPVTYTLNGESQRGIVSSAPAGQSTVPNLTFAPFAALLPDAMTTAFPAPLTVSDANVCSNAASSPSAAAGMASVPGPLDVPNVSIARGLIGLLFATVAEASAVPHWNTAPSPPTTTAPTFVEPTVVVRRGLRSILQIEKDFRIVGEAANGVEAVKMTRQLKPHVIIMDLVMPEKSGNEATAEILAEHPETRILLLTTFGTADDVARALEIGAAGVLIKTSDESAIIAAIRTVAAGGHAISEEIKRLIAESPPAPTLTPRQLEILNSLSRGYSNAEIAEVFGINEFTVREHVMNIMAKLDASNRTEAVAIAIRKQLLKI